MVELLLASFLTLAAQTPQATPVASAAPDVRVDRFEWSADEALARFVRRLVVRNDYGDIRARLAADGRILVTAMLQRLGDGPEIGVNVERHGDALAVTVVAPPGRRAVGAVRPAKTAVDRADLVVYVTAGAILEAQTLRGVVDARRLSGPILAATDEGELRLESASWLRARSSSGAITAVVGEGAERPTLVESDSGAISLSVVDSPRLRLEVETGGRVESRLELAERPAADGRTLRSLVRDPAAAPIRVQSATGAVEIVGRKP